MLNSLSQIKLLILFGLLLGIVACAPAGPSPSATITVPAVEPTQATTSFDRQSPLILPISVYVVDGPDDTLSSKRTVAEITTIYELINDIWAAANIVIDVQLIERLTMPQSSLLPIAQGQFQPFFNEAGRNFDLPQNSLLNAFYVQQLGGPNGINPFGANLFFVMDTPSVHDERVSSHEIGHILGLQHNRVDANTLMFSGTNGMNLSEEEIIVARYNARKLLEQAGPPR